ncbi:MAG: antibiotic biosynthesis monooxygenase [Robiginitomaculum sp.]|nr:MAG: antibiotic biosynthesis monooxygenase [Robiginitomaculum sp.]
MGKIILSGHIIVPVTDVAAVKAALIEHTRLTLAKTGCLVFRVKQDASNPQIFSVYEKFTTQTDFDNHQKRVHNSEWGKVAKNVERHYTVTST